MIDWINVFFNAILIVINVVIWELWIRKFFVIEECANCTKDEEVKG